MSAENSSHEELKWGLEIQFTVNVRIATSEHPIDGICTAFLGRKVFLHNKRLLQRFSISIAQQWEINYSLTNYADPYDVARILAWIVESHNSENIRSLLVNYFSQTQCDGMRLDVGSISWSYGYKFLGANKVPSLRVGFTLTA